MRNVCHIQTPENVSLDFELAGIGSRGVAVAIDTVIQNIFLVVVGVILMLITGDSSLNLMFVQENSLYVVIGLLIIFVTQFGYFFFFEYFMKGSTPGKKIVGIKVMMGNGEPLSFMASLIRNLTRIGDMLPGMYGVAIFSVIFTSRFMRVGDLAANTIVVKVNEEKEGFADFQQVFREHRGINITPREEALLIDYRERKRSRKNPLQSDLLEAQLYHHFYGKIGLIPNLPDQFTKRVYLDKLMEYIGIA